MRAYEFMTTPPITVGPDTPITEASRLLLEHGITAVPVVTQGRMVGVVSRGDLVHGRVVQDPRAHPRPVRQDPSEPPHSVGEVMTRDVVALPPTADEAEYAKAMVERHIKSVPVVSEGRVVGVVSVTDLLRLKVRSDDEIAAEVRSRLLEYTSGREAWTVTVDDGVVTISGSTVELQRRVPHLLAETVPGVVRVRYRSGDEAHAQPQQAPDARQAPHVPQSHAPDDGHGPAPARTHGPTDHRGLKVLDFEACLERLGRARVGRLGFVHNGDPVVLPVNHGLDGTTVVFRTTWGSKLQVAEHAGRVAFEVDGFDTARQVGWSVLVQGTASTVYEDEEVQRLDRLGVTAWAGLGDDAVWVRLRPDEITGREIISRTSTDAPVPQA